MVRQMGLPALRAGARQDQHQHSGGVGTGGAGRRAPIAGRRSPVAEHRNEPWSRRRSVYAFPVP
jgi:hypothetical protein